MSELVGREAQLAALASWLGDVTRLPASLILDGEPGIGKTSLFRAAVAEASRLGFRVLEASPAESESGLSYAALGDLIGDSLEEILPALAEPQRVALEVALLLRRIHDDALDERAVAVALLNGVRQLAVSAPVLVAIDDAQWLDSATAAATQFAFRRMRSEPVAILLCRRTGARTAAKLLDRWLPSPEHTVLGPLSIGAIHALVVDRLGLVLSRPVLRRLHELSRGNPFFALELARALQDGRLRLVPGEPLPLDLQELVGERLARLPGPTRSALAACAALSRPTIHLLGQVIDEPSPLAVLKPALDADVIRVEDGDIGFSHPLLSSAAYAALARDERQGLHARLAAAVPDSLERARHLALGTVGQDADVAEEVEAAAIATYARAGRADAVELIALAGHLTPASQDEALRRRSALEAQYRFESGDPAGASTILERLIGESDPGPERALLLARLARVRHFEADVGGGVALLREALMEAGDDVSVRGDIEEGLAWGLLLMRSDLASAWAHARSAVACADERGDPAALAEALAAMALTELVYGQPRSRAMERALELEPATLNLRVLRHPSFALGYVLTCTDELDQARSVYLDLQRRAEDRGDDSALAAIACHLSTVACLTGHWADAERLADEAHGMAIQNGQLPTQASALGRKALVLARRGAIAEAREAAARSLSLAGGPEFPFDRPATALARGCEHALWALGELELSLGRPQEAERYLGPLLDALIQAGVHEPGEVRFLGDVVEALIALGRLDEAAERATWIEVEAERVGRSSVTATSRSALGVVAAGRGDLEGAAEALATAVQSARVSGLPFELGRALLLLGRVQRRAASKRAAREVLKEAADVFDLLGAQVWAETARAELGRIGGRAPGVGTLTDAELRVAELVVRGLSNKEVATQLFVTPKTVEATLSRIYAKRGVRSRTELATLLATEGASGVS